jgi:trimethylamine---corrinoid protein Co-methyltransferase
MRTFMQVLSQDEKDQVHEKTLKILANAGVRVDSAKGRKYLKDAGAEVNENTNIVRLPRELVEESLKLAPKEFTLGARRPDWDLKLNNGDCHLLVDGEATFVIDRETGEQRLGEFDDWLDATRLIDGLDEIAMYWSMIESGQAERTTSDMFRF